MLIFLTALILFYALFNVFLIIGCLKFRSIKVGDFLEDNLPSISVIIAVRNEEDNIGTLLKSLENQYFNKNKFEVIIANDSSTDSTVAIIKLFQATTLLNLKLLNLENEATLSPKKRAISQALILAKNELIVTTDGDCQVLSTWLDTIARYQYQTQAKLISMPVTFLDTGTIFNQMQLIEFASLVVSGGVSMNTGLPNMCNGANIAYLRSAFDAVNGFEGNETIASGDDEFLMHKIAKKYSKSVFFLPTKEVLVYTQAPENLRNFYHQRIRWASKWSYYKSISIKLLALFVFIINVVFIGVLSTGFMGLVLLKILPEFIFLCLCLHAVDYPKKVHWIPALQLLYPFYVMFFAVFSHNKKYVWKGRKLK